MLHRIIDDLSGSCITKADQIEMLVEDLHRIFDRPKPDAIKEAEREYDNISLRLELIENLSKAISENLDTIQRFIAEKDEAEEAS